MDTSLGRILNLVAPIPATRGARRCVNHSTEVTWPRPRTRAIGGRRNREDEMCPKCLIDQLVVLLQMYMADHIRPFRPGREAEALTLIEEAKAMSHSHDEMVPVEEAEEASRT